MGAPLHFTQLPSYLDRSGCSMAESQAARDAGLVLQRTEVTETPRKRQRLFYGRAVHSPGGSRRLVEVCDVKFEPSPDKENKYEKAKRSKRNSAERAKLRRKADAVEDARFRAAEAARLKQHRAMQWIQQRIQQ